MILSLKITPNKKFLMKKVLTSPIQARTFPIMDPKALALQRDKLPEKTSPQRGPRRVKIHSSAATLMSKTVNGKSRNQFRNIPAECLEISSQVPPLSKAELEASGQRTIIMILL